MGVEEYYAREKVADETDEDHRRQVVRVDHLEHHTERVTVLAHVPRGGLQVHWVIVVVRPQQDLQLIWRHETAILAEGWKVVE